jgi:hypothetical protein
LIGLAPRLLALLELSVRGVLVRLGASLLDRIGLASPIEGGVLCEHGGRDEHGEGDEAGRSHEERLLAG